MSEADWIEAERVELLEERRTEWAENNVDIDERFGPGSFGCHEAMHVANMLAGLVEGELCNHSAVLRDPHWYKCARLACDNLAQLYLAIGKEHLNGQDSPTP
ncbi:hypothetical protein ACOJCM_10025 [Billgrantia sp. LNSP4103-1]|uniref:hypothetical protein n=1 Tax=Billgrantia sp. LNSP4103-1 TaxID=3410266 RepID=UPI00403F992C